MNTDINRRIAIGVGWTVSVRIFDRLIGIASLAILARLLLPTDFGLVAYATTFFALLEVFFQFSFETVLIRDQQAGRDSYDTAWTLNIFRGGLVAILMMFSASAIAGFFNEPEVRNILLWIAVLPALRGLENIGIVDFQKKLNFDKDFYFNSSVRVISAVATIVLAFTLRTFWALVYGMILRGVLRVILSYMMSEYRPRFSLSRFSRVFGFSKWLLLQNVFSGINARLPTIVLGRYFDAQILAFFTVGSEISNLAGQELASPIRRALFPGVAIIAHERQRMIDTIRSTIGVIAFAGLPASIGIAVTAQLLVPVFLGANWVEVVPIIQALAVNAVTHVLYSNSHIVFLALNRPQITTYVSILRLAFLAPLTLILVPKYGGLGAAWSMAIVNATIALLEYALVIRLLGLRFREIVGVVWRSIIGVSTMGACVYSAVNHLAMSSWQLSVATELAICVLIGIATYCATVIILWLLSGKPNGPESFALIALRSMVRRARSSLSQNP